MEYFIAIIIIGAIILLVVKMISKNSAEQAINQKPKTTANVEKEPRDFMRQGEGYLALARPIDELLKEDKNGTLNHLISLLQKGGIYERKYAAFALGQIGEERAIKAIESCLESESVTGVREAMEAALVALRMAPASKGHSEIERRKIIQKTY